MERKLARARGSSSEAPSPLPDLSAAVGRVRVKGFGISADSAVRDFEAAPVCLGSPGACLHAAFLAVRSRAARIGEAEPVGGDTRGAEVIPRFRERFRPVCNARRSDRGREPPNLVLSFSYPLFDFTTRLRIDG